MGGRLGRADGTLENGYAASRRSPILLLFLHPASVELHFFPPFQLFIERQTHTVFPLTKKLTMYCTCPVRHNNPHGGSTLVTPHFTVDTGVFPAVCRSYTALVRWSTTRRSEIG